MLARLLTRARGLFRTALFRRRGPIADDESAPLGIYGSPNAGKSSLANVLCQDWCGETLSSVSHLAHETREVRRKERVRLTDGDATLLVDVVDTPGLATHVSPLDLEIFYNMDPAEAEARATEATHGILEAIHALRTMEGMLLVIDSAADPYEQVNEVLLSHVRARKIPVVVVANKIDLPDARPERVREAFGRYYPVVTISALTREGIDDLYRAMFREFHN